MEKWVLQILNSTISIHETSLAPVVKTQHFQCRGVGSIPGWEDPLEKGKVTYFSILA